MRISSGSHLLYVHVRMCVCMYVRVCVWMDGWMQTVKETSRRHENHGLNQQCQATGHKRNPLALSLSLSLGLYLCLSLCLTLAITSGKDSAVASSSFEIPVS